VFQRLRRLTARMTNTYATHGATWTGRLVISSVVTALGEWGRATVRTWERLWMCPATWPVVGRRCARIAASFAPAPRPPVHLAQYYPHGYIAHSAVIRHRSIQRGQYVFIGNDVALLQDVGGRTIHLGDGVHLYGATELATGRGGAITIGAGSHIQPGGRLMAHLGSIHIGSWVDIAPNCAFYAYNHGTDLPGPPMYQPLETKGDIVVDDEVWLGYGVVVLSGVRIGRGAVVGAGSVVCRDIPPFAIAAGVPARVLRYRTCSSRQAVGESPHLH
jgi:acetyltransferase-like isoleucine patch superfamily enzyme